MQRETSNYVSHYQNYLDSKEKKSLTQDSNSDPSQTKLAARLRKIHATCKLCKLIVKREDVTRILNQGLFNKYTSSLDYYFTKDINALLARKRKAFCIRYFDDLIYDTSKEYLKKCFSRREAKTHMEDIKKFYTKFKDFPRFFDLPFYRTMSSMIRKHRRLEYFKVFKGKKQDDDTSRVEPLAPENEFQLLDMLGESFKRQVCAEQSSCRGQPKGNRLNNENSFVQIQKSFKELKTNLKEKPALDMDNPFSSDYYHYYTTTENIYPLYSRNDSENAIQNLAELVDKMKIDNYGKPKLKNDHQFAGKNIQQSAGSSRWSSPTVKNTNKQPGMPQTTSVTPHSRRAGGSVIPSESAKALALANKLFSNPNLSRQTQRNLLHEARSKSEKVSASPSARAGVKSGRGSSSEKSDPRFFGSRERPSKSNGTVRLNNPHSSTTNLKYNSNEVTSIANLSAGKRKLLIDVQDMNINRNNLYKTITDKFKSTCNLNFGSRMQLPGKDLTPYIDSVTEASKRSAKFSFSTGKKYLSTKRAEAGGKAGYFAENSSAMLQGPSDENCNQSGTGLRSKKSAQNSSSNRFTDKILQAHPLNTSIKITNTSKYDYREEGDANQILKHLQSEASNQHPISYGNENSNQPSENASKRVFKRVMSCGSQHFTPSRNHMQVLRGGTPQSKNSNLINEIIKLIETPDSKNELNQKTKGMSIVPHSVKSVQQNKRSKSSNSFFGKVQMMASPKPKLQSQPETVVNRRRNRSAESKHANTQGSPKRAIKHEIVY